VRLRACAEARGCFSIVSPGLPEHAEGVVRRYPEGVVMEARGNGQSPMAQLDRTVRITRQPGAYGELTPRLPQSALVPQRLTESLGFAGVLGALRQIARRAPGIAVVDVQVDGLLRARATFREVPKRVECRFPKGFPQGILKRIPPPLGRGRGFSSTRSCSSPQGSEAICGGRRRGSRGPERLQERVR
jgi:hypothetical protein